MVQAFDQYVHERHAFLGNGGSDFLPVNPFRPLLGSPLSSTRCQILTEVA